MLHDRAWNILSLRAALYWDITRRRVVIYRRFGTTYRSHLQESEEKRKQGFLYFLFYLSVYFPPLLLLHAWRFVKYVLVCIRVWIVFICVVFLTRQQIIVTWYTIPGAWTDEQILRKAVWGFTALMEEQVGRDSVVGTATCYGLDGLGIESRSRRDFPHPFREALGPTQPPVQWAPGLFRRGGGLKRPGRGVDHPPQSSTKVKEIIQLYFYSTCGPSWPVANFYTWRKNKCFLSHLQKSVQEFSLYLSDLSCPVRRWVRLFLSHWQHIILFVM